MLNGPLSRRLSQKGRKISGQLLLPGEWESQIPAIFIHLFSQHQLHTWYLSIHSSNVCLFCTSCVPGTVEDSRLSAEDEEINKGTLPWVSLQSRYTTKTALRQGQVCSNNSTTEIPPNTTESLQDAIKKQRRYLKLEGPQNYLATSTPWSLPPFYS